MKRYLEYYENEWPENIEELTAIENKPFVGYLNGGGVKYTVVPKPVSINYFYIESLEDNNVITLDSTTWAGYGDNKSKLEYSNDATSWSSMNGVDSITINNGEHLYMRCIDGNICKDMNSVPEEEAEIVMFTPLFKTSTNCNIGGNINTAMFDYTYKIEECVLSASAFTGLFIGIDMMTESPNNYIIDASKLVLPATVLAEYCYCYMFYGCTYLTAAPELPATMLAESCYESMFMSCESLVVAPELPATTLAGNCYSSMFDGCTYLTTAPEILPATTLAERCYSGMFACCTSLVTPPELPATVLAHSCYNGMFWECTSLTTTPELHATVLADSCYSGMFAACYSLTAAPELPATVLAHSCYDGMFSGCTSLTTAPELPATTLAERCYTSMFAACYSLTAAPELPATELVEECYYLMFESCTSLTTSPELPATALARSCYSSMFAGCSSLTTAPELPATVLVDWCYNHMFYHCNKLNYIKCLAIDRSAKECTYQWVNNVSPTGTFVKHLDMNNWTTGVSGIPSNWTVVDAEI